MSALARRLMETPQAVNNWRTRGVPPNRAKRVETLTGVSVKLLRPDDWADYWPELAEPAPAGAEG